MAGIQSRLVPFRNIFCNNACRSANRLYSSGLGGEESTVPVTEVEQFIVRCMESVGTKSLHAQALARNLTAADYRGHFSHGLNRLEMYVKDIQTGITVSDKEPRILKESSATAYVDGQNVLGPVVGDFCMDLAMSKAKDVGVGLVTAKGSNHYGIAGGYAMKALELGLLGMSFTNTSPLVVPTRAKKPTLGTNPLSLAAPGLGGDSFVLDMATSTAAVGKIELHNVKEIDIPSGWGVDCDGKMTHDPQPVLKDGGLMPLGGSELTGGYKGYGLGMLVEIFCGILAAGHYGPNIRKWKETDRVANLGQCFLAINPDAFAPDFAPRMQDFMNTCRGLETVEGESEVLVPGDPERNHMDMCDKNGGIPYHGNLVTLMNRLAKGLNVQPLQLKM